MDKPPVAVMRKLIALYNKDLKISNYSKLKKDELHKIISKKGYRWEKNGDAWDMTTSSLTKRNFKYTLNKDKSTSKTTNIKKKK